MIVPRLSDARQANHAEACPLLLQEASRSTVAVFFNRRFLRALVERSFASGA